MQRRNLLPIIEGESGRNPHEVDAGQNRKQEAALNQTALFRCGRGRAFAQRPSALA